MKHLKLIMLFVAICIGLAYTHKSINAASVSRGPGFELRNQSQLNIMFRLFVNNKKVADTELAPNSLYQWETNPNDLITVEVYEPFSKNILNKIRIDAKGKTKYIAWDPKRYNKPALYFFPQRRSDILAPDVPTSSFNLENNVEQKDIKRVR